MAISLGGFVISRLLAERAGVQDSSAISRISLIGAVIGATPFGIVMTSELARREASNETAVVVSPGDGGSGGGGGGATLVQIPNFGNMTYDQAQSLASSLGLRAQQIFAASNSQPIGLVINQTPAAGATVPRASTVMLVVSQGVQVPNLVGNKSDDAQKTLAALGLAVQVTNERNSATSGTVIAQDPQAGNMVSPGSSVTLIVSQGPNVTVLDVTGKPAVEAEKTLREAGFQVKQTPQPSSAINKGYVISQSPAAGASGLPGDMVTITVSTGMGVVLPEFTGQKADDAAAMATKLGLRPRRDDQNSSAVATGYVISQSPAAGSVVDPGTEITLVVSLGAEASFIELNDFRGIMYSEAREVLQDIDLKVRRKDKDSDKTKDMVIDQDPAPGFIKPESTVTLIVSTGKVGGPGVK